MTIQSARLFLVLMFAITLAAARSEATIVPFTEDFAATTSNWRDSASQPTLTWNAAGGPDGGSYTSGLFNFSASAPNSTPAILRGQDEFNSSGNAFVGNWIADDVTTYSVQVRHNAPTPLTFFTRISGPGNFPAVAVVNFAPVFPNTWTQLVHPIMPGNPQFVFEGPPSTFNSVFSNVGHLQIGVMVPGTLAGVNQNFTFDVDKVSIVPEPATAGLLLIGLSFVARRRA